MGGVYVWRFYLDFSWEVLKLTISTSHFMVCFGNLQKKVQSLWRVSRVTGARYCILRRWFFWNSIQYDAKPMVLSCWGWCQIHSHAQQIDTKHEKASMVSWMRKACEVLPQLQSSVWTAFGSFWWLKIAIQLESCSPCMICQKKTLSRVVKSCQGGSGIWDDP